MIQVMTKNMIMLNRIERIESWQQFPRLCQNVWSQMSERQVSYILFLVTPLILVVEVWKTATPLILQLDFRIDERSRSLVRKRKIGWQRKIMLQDRIWREGNWRTKVFKYPSCGYFCLTTLGFGSDKTMHLLFRLISRWEEYTSPWMLEGKPRWSKWL